MSRIATEVNAAVRKPAIVAKLDQLGPLPVFDTPQTFASYRYLLAHLSRFVRPDTDDWLYRLRMIHAKASRDESRQAAFRDRAYELFNEFFYSRPIVKSGATEVGVLDAEHEGALPTENAFGLNYKGNLSSFLDWSVFFYGAYEKEYLYFLRDLITDSTSTIFIDVGANIGHHSLFMSQYCKEVHSFEPNPNVRERLTEKTFIKNWLRFNK